MPINRPVQLTPYTDDYKQKVKIAWYKAGKPSIAQLIKVLEDAPDGKDDYGRVPVDSILTGWRKNEMWDFWAEELDSQVLTQVEDSLIQQKADMLRRHADKAWDLQKWALAYLEQEGFDSSSSAVSAFLKGAELERVSRGIGDLIVRMAEMDDYAIKEEIVKYLQRASENDQIVDADEVPQEKDDDTVADADTE